MNILRLSTLSLILAIAVITLGYNPSFADKPGSGDCQQVHCDHGEELVDLTYSVNLIGPMDGALRGAFEFEGGQVSATLESKGRDLKGDVAVTMTRPASNADCETGDADDQLACIVWEDVFNLCGLLGQYDGGGPDDGSGPTLLTTFTVELGDWSVTNSSERQWISFGFEIAANLSPPSSRPLSASLRLSKACATVAECRSNVPTAATPPGGISFVMTDASVHLTGKKGVTHQADCHGDEDLLVASGSTLVITATAP